MIVLYKDLDESIALVLFEDDDDDEDDDEDDDDDDDEDEDDTCQWWQVQCFAKQPC